MLSDDVYPHIQNLLSEVQEKHQHALIQISEFENRLTDTTEELMLKCQEVKQVQADRDQLIRLLDERKK